VKNQEPQLEATGG